MNKLMLVFVAAWLALLSARSELLPFRMVPADIVESIEIVKLHDGRNGSPTWFLPRICPIPASVFRTGGTRALMLLQTISGSDYYGPVHWRESSDNGRSWTEPQPIPGFGRRPFTAGVEEAVSDVIPQFHSKTNRIIAIGEII